MGDRELHLSILVSRGEMSLEREGIQLRRMPVRIGPEADIGDPGHTIHIVAPRGERTVTAVSPWRVALDGGSAIYADSTRDVLADTSAATPGNVRVGATDLGAILPDIKPGMSVYFY
jgi:hypothetical protein